MKGKNIFKLFFIFLCSINIFVLLNYPQKSYAVILFSENWDTGTPPTNWPCKAAPGTCDTNAQFNGWFTTLDNCIYSYFANTGISTARAHSGTRSFYINRLAGYHSTCDIRHDFNSPYPTKINIRFYMYLDSNWIDFNTPVSRFPFLHFLFTNSALSGTGFRINLLSRLPWGNAACGAGLGNVPSNQPYMFFTCENNTSSCSVGAPSPCYNLLDHLNEWVSVEFGLDAANKKYNVWINGTKYVDNVTVPMTQNNFTMIQFSQYVSDDTAFTTGTYIDDIVVADSYIGSDGSDGRGNTPPPSSDGSGSGDTSASGGSGCGFVKDTNGKGQKAKGEGLALMIMLIIVLLWIALIRRMFTIRIIQITAVLLFSLAVGCGGGSAPADSIPADSVPAGDSGRVQSIEFITYGGAPVYSTALNKIAFHRFDPTIIGGPDLFGNNDNTGTFELWIADPDGSNEGCISCGDVAGGPRRNQHKGAPTWHASGQWIVVAVEMPVHAAPHASAHAGLGAYLDLWAISPDGAQWYQLTYYANIVTTPRFSDTPAGALIPRFSRSGNKLVWAEMIGYDAQHPFAIWRLVLADFVVDATGPHLINHTRFEPGTLGTTFYEAWSFSPDDNYITVASESGGIHPGYMDVQIWNPNAGTLVNLTQTNDQYEEQAVFSPDGQWIAFMSTHGQSPPYDPSNDFWGTFRTDVWLMRADGTSSERLSYFSDPAHAEYLPGAVNRAVPVSWSPDGKSIYVNVDQNHGSQQTHETQRIYRINLR